MTEIRRGSLFYFDLLSSVLGLLGIEHAQFKVQQHFLAYLLR